MTRRTVLGIAIMAAAAPLRAQIAGAIAGNVRDAVTGQPLDRARVMVDSGPFGALTDSTGAYRIRELQSGWHRVRASQIGYQSVVRESVLVQSAAAVTVDFALQPQAVSIAPVTVETKPDIVLDPRATATTQRISGEELRKLPISSVEEAIGLAAGTVGESYRGGRIGEQSFIIDGLGVKNQLGASDGGLGVHLPPDILEEASLITDGFSARYGQAISGMINVVTKDGGPRWQGRAAYEGDRPWPQGWDYGLDRFVLEGDGPLWHGIRAVAVLDARGRIDAEPVAAPLPADTLDPRHSNPWLLPHNSGENYDAAAKLIIPFGSRETVRLFALTSLEQRLLYDPAYKYDAAFGPVRRIAGTLASAQWQHRPSPEARRPFFADLRFGYFGREFLRGTAVDSVHYRFGAFSFAPLHIVGEDMARAQDTTAARGPIAGLLPPRFSDQTPWGVPAFFLGSGSTGEVAWNHYRELREQADFDLGFGPDADLYFGGSLLQEQVQTFQRAFGYLPVGDSVPPALAANFSPLTASLYTEWQQRAKDLALTFGLRYDQFDPKAELQGGRLGARQTVSPRFAVSAPFKRATFVASWGRFAQAPDFQYLVDAAFDDTARTGHFRRGNPDLGYETATQYQFSVRARPSVHTSLHANVYVRRLDGLVASVPLGVNPDSSIFGNADFGTVKGVELIAERDFSDWWGARASYTLQQATATATNAFQLYKVIHVDPITGDTLPPSRVEFPLDFDRRHSVTVVLQARVPDSPRTPLRAVLGGLEGAVIVQYLSGLPFSYTNTAGDSLIGLPNSGRLPAQSTVDALLRWRAPLKGRSLGVYLDVRNLFNRQNVVAVRRDTGQPAIATATLQAMAQTAYDENPQPIPYESPRYRAWADLNHNGYVDGSAELMPLYLAAARDFTQPLLVYGPPRLVRLGVEIVF